MVFQTNFPTAIPHRYSAILISSNVEIVNILLSKYPEEIYRPGMIGIVDNKTGFLRIARHSSLRWGRKAVLVSHLHIEDESLFHTYKENCFKLNTRDFIRLCKKEFNY